MPSRLTRLVFDVRAVTGSAEADGLATAPEKVASKNPLPLINVLCQSTLVSDKRRRMTYAIKLYIDLFDSSGRNRIQASFSSILRWKLAFSPRRNVYLPAVNCSSHNYRVRDKPAQA